MKNQIAVILSFAASAALFLNGCSTEETVLPDRSMEAADIISRVNALPATVRTFSAGGSLSVETPQMSQSVGFDLAVKKPDSVLITVTGPFGITLGKGLFTRESFVAYNALNNTVYEGNPAVGMRSLPFLSGIDIGVMIDALSGVRRIDDAYGEPDSFVVGTRSFIFTYLGNPRKTKFYVDTQSYLITRVITYRGDDSVLWEERYSYSGTPDGLWEPSTIRISVPDRSMNVEFVYDEISLNTELPVFRIEYPGDATRMTVD